MSTETTTDTSTSTTTEPTANDPSYIWHVFCSVCWPVPVEGNIAICGTERPAGTVIRWDRPETVCVVCDELHGTPCRVCGL